MLLILSFLCMGNVGVYAQGSGVLSYQIDQEQDVYQGLEGYLLVLPEQSRTFSIGEVAGQDASAFLGMSTFARRKPIANVYWTRLALENTLDHDLYLVYRPGGRFTNFVDVYVSYDGQFEHLRDGLFRQQSEKSLPINRNQIGVPIRVPAGEDIVLFSRLENVDGRPIEVRAFLQPLHQWQQANTQLHWWQGLFHGILWLIAIFYLLLYRAQRRIHYLYYVGYIVAASVYFLNFYGLTVSTAIGDYPYSYIALYLASTSLMPIFYLQFQRAFLRTTDGVPGWDLLMRGLIFLRLAELVGMVIILLADFNFDFVQQVHRSFVYIESAGMIAALYGLWKTQRTGVVYVILGALVLHVALFVSIVLVQTKGMANPNTIFQIGVFLEILLFCVAQILELQKVQIDKVKAEKESQSKSEFLSVMSHEIRTPLNAVIGTAHLLLEENPRLDQKENLTTLKYAADNLLALVNDILDFSKIESGKVEFIIEDINLRNLLHQLHQSFIARFEEKEVDLVLDMDANIPPTIKVDAMRLTQVINNLVGNAYKFTKTGEVRISVKVLEISAEEVRLKFSISDTGIGIDAKAQQKIFNRFTQASSSTTREYGGSGLGLSIIKNLLELQGVEINVYSEVGKGSTFYFEQTFQYDPTALGSANEESNALFEPLGPARILLVEDNKVNVMLATKFLTKWGLKVEVAENGKEAIAKVDTAAYDLVLMDLQMPVMDGFVASREIRKFTKELPIIALSAAHLSEIADRIYEVGMNDFVTKPFNPTDLYKKVKKHLEIVSSKT